MVFSCNPVFVDPSNWQQQPNHPQANGGDNSHQLLPPLPPQQPHAEGFVGSIRPGSMADRARLANIPPPEAALKCPRCESTNTKFCYFNNYSLSQPRHFCKTCRRYWTREGALRNVPVGGGCRRNKKNKRNHSNKSPASSEKQTLSGSSSLIPSVETTHEPLGQFPQPPNIPFMASLQSLNRYAVGNMGSGSREIHEQNDHMGFQIGSGGGNSSVPGGGMNQWRLQQFPFLNGFESTSAGSYPFQNESIEAPSGLVGDLATNSRVSQMPSVKMEENGAMNLSRIPLSVPENHQYYSWTDISGLASSSARHLFTVANLYQCPEAGVKFNSPSLFYESEVLGNFKILLSLLQPSFFAQMLDNDDIGEVGLEAIAVDLVNDDVEGVEVVLVDEGVQEDVVGENVELKVEEADQG
ncbi:hypothetical protein Fmac_022172 [Flemingia macrophylla]|uniref:Dof zinc finger protein n=1 Tax=Flemingia macrophylla TaxID=520843 RepID=A0ABD1M0S6_9FABA